MRKKLLMILFFIMNILTWSLNFTMTRINGTSVYDNGETVGYVVRIENPTGSGLVENLEINVPLGGITSSLDAGGTGTAFSSLSNILNPDNQWSGAGTDPNFNSGVFSPTGDFKATGVSLPEGAYVEYFVRGDINPGVNGDLTIDGNVKDEISGNTLETQSNIMTRADYIYTITKSTTQNYYEAGGNISYKIVLSNNGASKIKDLTVNDILLTNLENIMITGTSGTNSTSGSFSTSGNLVATGVEIAAGETVEYMIDGMVKSGVTGVVSNEAISEVREQEKKSNIVELDLAQYSFNVEKSATSVQYTPGSDYEYKLKISNTDANIKITKMEVEDIISTITTDGADGNTINAFVPGSISVSGVASSGNSSVGNFSLTGDLQATDVEIEPGDYVEYTIIGEVNSNAVGDISNKGEGKDRNNIIKESNEVISQSIPAQVVVNKGVGNSVYSPGETVSYSVVVDNVGGGIGKDITVKDLINSIQGNLANSGGISGTDIPNGSPFDSWTITASLGSGSTKSTTVLLDNGGTSSDTDLNDVITIFPNERVVYTVELVTKNTSIGNLSNISTLEENGSVISTSPTATITPNPLEDNSIVTVEKTIGITEYTPGETVEYTITVKNPGDKLMNNVTITDLISQIEATQLDGSSGMAFENWQVDVVSTSGDGTVPGDFNYGATVTDDFQVVADIGPNGEIVYKLTAKIKNTTVGVIKDTVTGDNTEETGTGIKMSNPLLEIAKNINETEYTPGGMLSYTIDVDNPGDGYAVDIFVEDRLAEITTTLIDGTTGPAYKSWDVTAEIYDISSGTPVLITDPSSDPTDPGFSGTFSGDQSNNQVFSVTNAVLGPNRRIRYKVDVIVSDDAKGLIKNTANVNNNLMSDKGAVTRDEKISVNKSGPGNYVLIPGAENKIVYTITITNAPEAGVGINIPVKDEIDKVTSEILGTTGTIESAFSSWEISVPTLVGPETTSLITAPITSPNILEDTIDISPSGQITYTVTAVLNENIGQEILYGALSNKVDVGDSSSTAVTTPKLPELDVTKQALDSSFVPGQYVEFKVVIENDGDGYANNAIVNDIINTQYFDLWEITGTPNGTGTTTGIVGTVTNPDVINTTVDIAPNGSVVYNIRARVKNDITDNLVLNTVSVTDVQNDITQEASASIAEGGDYNQSLDIKKRSNSVVFSPGGQITYFLDVENKTAVDIDDIRVEDLLSQIQATYANDLTNNVTDLPNQSAFDNWEIYKDVNNLNPTTLFQSLGTTDLNDITMIPGNSTVTYKIVANVNERVVSDKIKNIVDIYNVKNGLNDLIGISSIEHNKTNPSGGINRVVDKARYIPGVDTLTYTITISSNGPGYQNNININELIKDLQVELIDGTFGNPFIDPLTGNYNFTVDQVNTNPTNGTEQVLTSGPVDNENLVGTVDIKPGESLQFKITGPVRLDAIGDINNKGLISAPYRYNLNSMKTVLPTVYEPGEEITYIITVNNNSNGNAKDIDIVDDIGDLKVLDSEGNMVTAFTNIQVDPSSSTVGFKADLGNPVIDANGVLTAKGDIPINGKLIYRITATINEKAVGNVVNVAYIDGDSVANQVGSVSEKLSLKKEIIAFYDKDDVQIPLSGGFSPGGYVEFEITSNNIGKGILDDSVFKDALSQIMTSYSDGTTGRAFDEWLITLSSQTGVSTNPDINNSIVTGAYTQSDIDTLVDIHPGGGFTYIIKCKINEKVVGSFNNKVTVGNTDKTTPDAVSASPKIKHTKKAFESDGVTPKTIFLPGETVVYKMRVENNGDGIDVLETYKDIVANIKGEVAESSSSGETPTEVVFESYNATFTTSGGNVTTIGTFNQDINLPNQVTIAPDGFVEFTITGVLKKNLIGNFRNRSSYTGGGNKNVTLVKVPTTIEVNKTLVELNGQPFNTGDKYTPGDSLKYELVIENTGDSFYDDLQVRDNLNGIVTDLSGDTVGSALENTVISVQVTNVSGEPVLTYIQNKSGNSQDNIVQDIDLAPGDKVTYTITGDIVNNALGNIPGNIATVGGSNYESDGISPVAPNITSTKTLISPVDKIYGPNEEVVYELTLTNTGDGYGDDIEIKDLLSQVMTEVVGGTQGRAFSSWTFDTPVITETDSTYSGNTIIDGSIQNNQNLNIEVDIAPTATLKITIRATTSNVAVGPIVNTSTLNGEEKKSEEITARIAQVQVEKVPILNEYSPDGSIGFAINVKNTTNNAIANNISLVDIISSINVDTISNGNEQAFKDNWVISTVINGDPADVYVGGVPTSGDINIQDIDIGPMKDITVKITGFANSKATGKIVNTGNWSYNGQGDDISAEILPYSGEISLEKTTQSQNYKPENIVTYSLKIKNIGKGYIDFATVIDDILSIETDIAGTGTNEKGQAFDSFTVTGVSSGNSNSSQIRDTLFTNGYKGDVIVYPQDTLVVTIEAKVNEKALGSIENILTGTYDGKTDEGKVIINPLDDNLSITKSVDKNVYESQDTLVYTLTVTNNGEGWAENINIVDEISKIESTFISQGTEAPVFESWTVSYLNSGYILPITTSDNTDLNVITDIPPKTSIVFTITGKLKVDLSGDVKNTGSYTKGTSTTNSNEVITSPKIPNFTFEKTANKTVYIPGEEIEFTIKLNNTENIAVEDIKITDLFSMVEVDSSEGDMNSSNKIPAFTNWTVESIVRDSGDNVTSNTPSIGTVSTTDMMIETDLKAKEGITIVVSALVNDGTAQVEKGVPIGNIINIATFEYKGVENQDNATVEPGQSNLEFSKNIFELDGEVYTNQEYSPGDVVKYKILVKNTGDSLADNVKIEDQISQITTELSGIGLGQALDNGWTIELNKGEITTQLFPDTFAPGSNIDLTADIEAGDTVEIIITGTISEKALGTISKNTVSVNSQGADSQELNGKSGILQVEKKIEEGEIYNQGGTIKYNVIISNTGEGFLSNVSVNDNISGIKAESIGGGEDEAFKTGWTINMSNLKAGTSFTNTYPLTSVNLLENIDIAPGDVITFTIEGVVEENIVGDITNTVNVIHNNTPIEKSVISTSKPGEVTVQKSPLNVTYTPNGEIGFDIIVSNISKTSVANDIEITDLISTIESLKIGGGTASSFKPNWTISASVTGDTVNSDITNIPVSGDINGITIDLGKETFVTIQVRGFAAENIYGRITNEVDIKYNNTPSEDSAFIEPVDGEIKIEKVVDNTEYTGGDKLQYTITIENTGLGTVAGFSLIDNIKDIMTEVSGEGMIQGNAFQSWIVISRSVPVTSSINSENLLNGYEGVMDIYPGDKIEIILEGTTSESAFGTIENIANGKYITSQGDVEISDNAISNPNLGIAQIIKSVDKNIYIPGEFITYTLEIKNTGAGWIRNLDVEDKISEIKTEILGAIQGDAFDLTTVEITTELIDPLNSITVDENAKPNLSAEVDIREGTSVKINIKVKVNLLAVGDINNTGSINTGSEIINSNEVIITQEKPEVTLVKEVDKNEYDVSAPLTYTIVIENSSANNINSIVGKDMFSSMRAIDSSGNLVYPFEGSLSVQRVIEGNVIVENSPGEDISDILHMQGNSKITYTIQGIVKDNIVGVIENTAEKSGDGFPAMVSVSSSPKIPVLSVEKTVMTEINQDTSISQEEKVTYTIKVTTTNPAFNVTVQDAIRNLKNRNNETLFDLSTINVESVTENGVGISYSGDINSTSDFIIIDKIVSQAEIVITAETANNIILESDEKITNTVTTFSDQDGDDIIDGEPQEDFADLDIDQPELTVEKIAVLAQGDTELYQGKDIEYIITVKNETPITAISINGGVILSVTDAINAIENSDGDTVYENIQIVSVKDDNEIDVPKVSDLSDTSVLGYTGDFSDSESVINLTRVNGESQIIVTVKGTVREDISFISQEPITNTVELYNGTKAEATVLAGRQELNVEKVAITDEVLLGEDVEFEITVSNIGKSFANDVVIIDQISKIEGKDFRGNTIPVFTEWEVTGVAGANSSIGTFTSENADLNITDAKIAIGEKLTYKIIGKTSMNLNEDKLENIVQVTDSKNRDSKESSAEVSIRKPMISVDKEAGVRETSIGKFVPYTILVKNNEDQEVKNIYLRDNPPAGFKYVEDSLGVIKNNERVDTINTEVAGNRITIGPFDLRGQEELEIVYLMKVSIGAVHGKYKNIVFATNSSGTKISNDAEAEVEVVEDPLFETTTVIGKIFHDRDGDGTQDDPRATKIKIQQNIPESSYVPNSTVAIIDDKNIYIKDQSVPIDKGIEFKEVLYGRKSEKDDLEKSKITLFIGLKDIDNLGDLRVTTNEGTDITLTKNDKIIIRHSGLKKKGMSSQNIVLRRELLKRTTFKDDKNKIKYYEKITIINTALQEEGIPGARIASVEGLVIITDQYGRFHIPEVSSKKGENYILKVDPKSLPVGAVFMTENPKVQRLGSAMIKYNFGVVLPKSKLLMTGDGRKILKVNVHPNMLFQEKSSILKPVISKKVLERIKSQLSKGDILFIKLNKSENLKLTEKREKSLKTRLQYLLKETGIKIVVDENVKGRDK